jgi:hypothetical protein
MQLTKRTERQEDDMLLKDLAVGAQVQLSSLAFVDYPNKHKTESTRRSVIEGLTADSVGVVVKVDNAHQPKHFQIQWTSNNVTGKAKFGYYQHWGVCELALLELSD